MNRHTIMDVVTSYMEFATLRQKITRDWNGFTRKPGYPAVQQALMHLEASNLGGYLPESAISHPEFLSPHAYFTLSTRESLDVTIKTSTRLVGPARMPGLERIREIMIQHRVEFVIYVHEAWNKPHVVLLVE